MTMQEFEWGIKPVFNGYDDQRLSVDLRGVKDDPNNGVSDDTIIIEQYVSSQSR